MTEILTPNAEQQAYIDAVAKGQHTLLTGPGGTGKSFTLDRLREKYPYGLSVCGTTGIAALNVKGMTIHSWAGLGLGTDTARHLAKKITDKKDGKIYQKMIAARRLAVDEVSMMSGELVGKLDEVLRTVRKCDEPFGGVQMLFIGDFLQLPPVIKSIDYGDEMDLGDIQAPVSRFAFNSEAWERAGIQVHELRTIVRQKDLLHTQVLGKIRRGIVDDQVIEVLNSRIHAEDPDAEIRPVKMNGYNGAVDSINMRELLRLQGETNYFQATDTGIPMFVEQLKKHCIAQDMLTLKVGAQVMLLRNVDTDGGLVNGSLGIVRDFASDSVPMVEFKGVPGLVKCEPHTWEISRDGEVLAARTQIPLRLAWAWTIHKSQGQTLDKIEVDLRSCFECGQGYVALSRCRTLEGTFLTGFDPAKIRADAEALQFYGY